MRAQPRYITYRQTGAFSSIVTDYLDQDPALSAFYTHQPDLAGIRSAIEARKETVTERALLVQRLTEQYQAMPRSEQALKQIALLASENTFTICTAHQPNIFTGHLYFIYKILHAIRLTEELNLAFPENAFIPVYYMGSEDADLDELGEVFIRGSHYRWQTKQQGAVGRMSIDRGLLDVLASIEGQLSVEPHGPAMMELLKSTYQEGKTIERATFELVHALFGKFGLLVFLPDNRDYKSRFAKICEKEILGQFSQKLVSQTVSRFPEKYKVQAGGRDINLFYLGDQSRERIIQTEDGYRAGTQKQFTQNELLTELKEYPERFSPNVILRPVFQEMLLPNVAFIGGGGELAYWLELKAVFEACQVPFPVLVLRNSFMLLSAKVDQLMQKLSLSETDIFRQTNDLETAIALRESTVRLTLHEEKEQLKRLYQQIRQVAGQADPTLEKHTEALRVQSMKRLEILEKKMMRAAKKRSDASLRQLQTIRNQLFPQDILQERIDNIFPYLSVYGLELIDELYEASGGLRQEFTLLHI